MSGGTPWTAIQADRDLVFSLIAPAVSGVNLRALEHIRDGKGDDAKAVQQVITYRQNAQAELVSVLQKTRSAIASLEEYALGGFAFDDPYTGEHAGDYPIRDALLSEIDTLLTKIGATQ